MTSVKYCMVLYFGGHNMISSLLQRKGATPDGSVVRFCAASSEHHFACSALKHLGHDLTSRFKRSTSLLA